ncbi:MAG: protein kinase [Melioribacteraceae bacterium]|nr:protein kinase [Melioribacteraceae bacterium]
MLSYFMVPTLNKILAFVITILLLTSCSDRKDFNQKLQSDAIWYKQANVDHGSRIIMQSINEGVAISRGAGYDIKGNLYQLKHGKWESVFKFDYSDNPQIAYNEEKIWFIHHETHHNFWHPRFFEYDGSKFNEIILPKVMWDATDYSMWNGIEILEDGTAWMIGQLGNILFYDGKVWSEFESPLKNVERTSIYFGDLNDIEMVSKDLGWAVGREGVIIKFENGKWNRIDSPVETDLRKISMIDASNGWIVGDRGTILKFENGKWQYFENNYRVSFTSVISDGLKKAWITGTRSTLLEWDGLEWKEIESIKSFEDIFEDVDFIKDANDDYKIWVIGQAGIYTTSQNLGFSFTDITTASSIRKEGRAATFFDGNSDGFNDLAIISDGGPNLVYKNLGNNVFSEISREQIGITNASLNQSLVLGDLDKDNKFDLLEILDDLNYNLAFGKGEFNFAEDAERSKLELEIIDATLALTSAKFIDFNNDGNLDIYISNFSREDMLFENDGYGNFTNIYKQTGINKKLNRQAYGVVINDFNNDMLADILIVYRFAENNKFLELYLNKGNFTFEEKESEVFRSNQNLISMSAISADFNNDGTQDIFLFNGGKTPMLLLNDGDANFTNYSTEAGFIEAIQHPEPTGGILNAADVNNDGYIDIYISSKLYLNSPGLKFTEVSEQIGLSFTGNPSFGDIDKDGDLDLFIGISKNSAPAGETAKLYRNNLSEGNSIKIKFNADKSNRTAIGTKVSLVGKNKNSEEAYRNTKYFGFGESPLSQQNISELHFGLIDTLNYLIEVEYPSGIKIEINNIEPNKTYTVTESSLVNHYITRIRDSIQRSINLADWKLTSIKLFLLIFTSMVIYQQIRKWKSNRIISSWYFIITIFVFFLLLIHFTLKTNFYFEWILPIVLPSLFMFAFAYYSNRYIEERESKYISHFKLMEILGVGGMGKVFKALDSKNNKLVAIKIINPTLLKDEENKRRLNSEGRLLSSIDHKNIVKVFEFGETEEHSYIAMEYLSGGTLEEFVANNFPLDKGTFKKIAIEICEGLIIIHENNVLHRDLKSQNIMFDENNSIRIMDFGLSKSPLVSTMTSLGTVVGTLGYVAPEQITNIQIDQRTDIFSFGVILYQMLTKKLPFTGENEMALIHSIFNTIPPYPSELNNSVEKTIDNIVMKCIEKDIDKRYNSASQIKKDLLKI